MKNLRTMDEAFYQNNEGRIYVVAALPGWKHYDPNECPAPIRAWMQQYYPSVEIELLSADTNEYVPTEGSKNLDPSVRLSLPKPIFRLGFNAQQAEHFNRAWTTVPPDCSTMPDDFYFVLLDFPSAHLMDGCPDGYVPVMPPRDQASRDKVAE